MNTIEQAARRLEQLRRAGVDVQDPAPAPAPADAPPTPSATVAAAEAVAAPQGHETASAPAPSSYAASASAEDRRSRDVTVDLLRMQRAGLLVPGQPRSQLEEEFRIVKRPLLENVRGQGAMRPDRANLIMVTSALAGEGKTQTAINLATSIAMELDHTVLLVEADVLRPSALERLGVQASKGLLDLLEFPQTQLSDVLLRTNIPKLTLLPAGTASSRSTELLASGAMNSLLNELASKYADRIIIFDTPPLLSTTESRVLATHMGQVVMVIEANKTPINTIKQAFATVENHPVVMSMLNKYRGPKGSTAYGYYAP
nr:XrtA-associated tyrosine autokinase [uncultured Aquabacterium sp.]